MRLEPTDISRQIAKELAKPRKETKGHMFPAWVILKQLYPALPWYKLVWKWLFYKANRELPLPDKDANEPPTIIQCDRYPIDVILCGQYKPNGAVIRESQQVTNEHYKHPTEGQKVDKDPN
ncbi:hypothetical protein [Acinetobacter sp.]|uniref:hypothetical protein n=1 Tax=Acinetobacter sp. TaxID=472 RepID=UPI0037528936